MAIYVEIDNVQYHAIITGRLHYDKIYNYVISEK